MKISLNNLKINTILLLVVLMPFHGLMMHVLKVSFFALWRDILIAFLFGIAVLKGIRADMLSLLSFIKIIFCVLFAVVFHDSSMSASIWINVLRIYLFPSLIIVACSQIRIEKEDLDKILKMQVIVSSAVSAFGLIQLFFIGRPYLIWLGVGQASVLLADGTQRNIGIFQSANIMAMYLLLSIIILLYKKELFNKISYILLMLLLLIGFAFTYSMSAFLALAIDIYIYIRKIDTKRIRYSTFINACLTIIIIILSTFLIIANNPEILMVLQVQLGEKINDIVLTLLGMNFATNSSALAHYNDLVEGFAQVIQNPLGLGFAKESFMVFDKVDYRQLLGIKESSIITIFFDFGIPIGVLFLLPIIYCLCRLIKQKTKGIEYCRISSSIIISILVMYIFLPVIQSYELSFYLNLFAGLAYYYLLSHMHINH